MIDLCSEYLSQGVSQALFDDVIRHFPNPCEFPNYF